MKLAAIFNVWDGEELLEQAIINVRPLVDVVIVTWQQLSNAGNVNPELWVVLRKVEKLGLVDYFQNFTPGTGKSLIYTESRKRSGALQIAKEFECSHYIFIDVDEFYDQRQFLTAKKYIEQNEVFNSFCKMYTYFLKPTWRLNPMEQYHVPFIQKITTKSRVGTMKVMDRWSFSVDPTRAPSPEGKTIIFEPEQLVMHHYSWVRKNLEQKLRNSSANDNTAFSFQVDTLLMECKNFKNDGRALPYYKNYTITEVDNIFNLNL